MRAAYVTLLLAAVVSGCTGGTPGNPNLAAPKLILDTLRSDGNMTLFVHGAFREQTYAYISLELDNRSIVNRTDAFSVEETVPGPGFFLDLTAVAGTQPYEMRARVDLNQTGERVHIALLGPNGWSEGKVYGVPYEHLLDHVKVVS